MEKKMTKKEMFIALAGLVETVEMVGEVTSGDMLKFLEAQVELLDKKAAKAKETAAKKRAESDALTDAVLAVLTDEFQTRQQVTDALGMEDVTVAKVGARLTKLVNAEKAVKELQKVGDSKVMCYKLKGEEVAEA